MKDYQKKRQLSPEKFRAQLNLLNDAARRVLASGFGRQLPADRVLASYFRENRRCGSSDRAFISETVYALLRFWGFVRLFLPVERREELERGSIRLTDYELSALLMSGVFINGDFDKAEFIRNTVKLPALPRALENPTARANQLSEYFGCKQKITDKELLPEWIYESLPENMDKEKFLKILSIRPPMWIRMQCDSPEKVVNELVVNGAEIKQHETLAAAFSVRAKVNLFTLGTFRDGCFEIQDLARQCVGIAASPNAGERWLDPCAGAGGKTLQLAQMMNRKGSIVAGDIRPEKLEDLKKRARRAGFPNISTKAHNGSVWKGKHQFDGVLLDAPCSCSGVWRRNPGSQWKLTQQDIDDLSKTQLEIMNNYANAVKVGGVMVYATCSIFDQENSCVVRKFLDSHQEYKLDPFPHPIYGTIVPGMVRIDSIDGDCDALFVARLRKVK